MTDCPRCVRANQFHTFRLVEVQQPCWNVRIAWGFAADGRLAVALPQTTLDALLWDARIDEAHLDHIDPSQPGIVGVGSFTDFYGECQFREFLLDGRHRAVWCQRNRTPFRVYRLTLEESNCCLTRAKPLEVKCGGGPLVTDG